MNHTLALVGDHSETVVAHRAIPSALAAAARELSAPIESRWLATADIARAEDLQRKRISCFRFDLRLQTDTSVDAPFAR